MNCECGKPFVRRLDEISTCMGYFSQGRHDHDDNCRTRVYICKDGHRTAISRRNRCPKDGCEWAGKAECSICHHGKKLDEWPLISA